MQGNAWGGCDVHGNAWESSHDSYGNYSRYSVTNPSGPKSGSDRVGSWYGTAGNCRSAYRYRFKPSSHNLDNNFGFRVYLNPSVQ